MTQILIRLMEVTGSILAAGVFGRVGNGFFVKTESK